MAVNRILVLRGAGMGDLLTALPAFRAIRRNFPDAWIIAGIPRPFERLIAQTCDEVIDVQATASTRGLDSVGRLSSPVDIAINLHGRGPDSHRSLLRLGPRRLIAFAHPDIDVEGPPWINGQHEIDRWCDLVNMTLHLDADPDDFRLSMPSMHRDERLVVIHAGAGDADKEWPWERFAQVAQTLKEQGHVIALTGDDRDRARVENIRSAADLPIGSALAGLTDIDALMSVVARASLVISGDTGVGHLATALGTPSVLLFGASDPAVWGPRSGPHTVLQGRDMWDIPAPSVLQACQSHLARIA
jgi:ADP-heptose:LPS heptosyltransferase